MEGKSTGRSAKRTVLVFSGARWGLGRAEGAKADPVILLGTVRVYLWGHQGCYLYYSVMADFQAIALSYRRALSESVLTGITPGTPGSTGDHSTASSETKAPEEPAPRVPPWLVAGPYIVPI